MADPVLMRFFDAPLGCRFRHPGSDRVWIKLSDDDCGLIAEYDARHIQRAVWYGQQICSFAETLEDVRTLEIEVLG